MFDKLATLLFLTLSMAAVNGVLDLGLRIKRSYTLSETGPMIRRGNNCHQPGDDEIYPCNHVTRMLVESHSPTRGEAKFKYINNEHIYFWNDEPGVRDMNPNERRPPRKDGKTGKLMRSVTIEGPTKVPYLLNATALGWNKRQVNMIQDALRSIESITCVRFVPLASQPGKARGNRSEWYKSESYLLFTAPKSGCSARLGMDYGPGNVNLAPNCFYPATVTHELLHALGLPHEQTRADRDRYLFINKANIKKENTFNFDLRKTYRLGKYDDASVMHYMQNFFAIDRSIPVIFPRHEHINPKMFHTGGCTDARGCDRYLSQGDILKLRQIYGILDGSGKHCVILLD